MSVTVLYTLVGAGVWILIIGEISLRQVVVGLVAGAQLAMISKRGPRRAIPIRELPVRLLYLLVYVLALIPYDILRSNLDMARRLLCSTPDIRPGIIRIDLGDVSDATSALVAHALTMTPGELVIILRRR